MRDYCSKLPGQVWALCDFLCCIMLSYDISALFQQIREYAFHGVAQFDILLLRVNVMLSLVDTICIIWLAVMLRNSDTSLVRLSKHAYNFPGVFWIEYSYTLIMVRFFFLKISKWVLPRVALARNNLCNMCHTQSDLKTGAYLIIWFNSNPSENKWSYHLKSEIM